MNSFQFRFFKVDLEVVMLYSFLRSNKICGVLFLCHLSYQCFFFFIITCLF